MAEPFGNADTTCRKVSPEVTSDASERAIGGADKGHTALPRFARLCGHATDCGRLRWRRLLRSSCLFLWESAICAAGRRACG